MSLNKYKTIIVRINKIRKPNGARSHVTSMRCRNPNPKIKIIYFR